MSGDSDEYTFAHALLTIEWNLMARSDNVVHLSVEHIEWSGECLIFYFATTKTDQNGEKQRLPWHVYSNPLKPHICPVLAFSKYVLSHPGVLQDNGRNKLFPGDNQYNRFLKIFHSVVEKHSAEILALGVDPNDLGSHSTRKGSATLVASGCIVAPPHSSLCLRAGWSMGGVKDRYIHHESAGDQFVGRTVTGLSCLSTEFACSPCYFDFTDIEDEGGMRQELDDFIRSNIVGGRQMTARVTFMAKYLFACVCYHYDYLKKHLHHRNRLLSSTIFSHVPEKLRKLAVVRFPWNKTRDTPFLTGVPPHILMMSDMKRFEKRLNALGSEMMEGMKEELNKRDIGGGMYHAL